MAVRGARRAGLGVCGEPRRPSIRESIRISRILPPVIKLARCLVWRWRAVQDDNEVCSSLSSRSQASWTAETWFAGRQGADSDWTWAIPLRQSTGLRFSMVFVSGKRFWTPSGLGKRLENTGLVADAISRAAQMMTSGDDNPPSAQLHPPFATSLEGRRQFRACLPAPFVTSLLI